MALIDTYEVVTALANAGLEERQGKIIADAINSVEKTPGLAKSSEVAELKGMLKVIMAINIGMALGMFGLFLNTM